MKISKGLLFFKDPPIKIVHSEYRDHFGTLCIFILATIRLISSFLSHIVTISYNLQIPFIFLFVSLHSYKEKVTV